MALNNKKRGNYLSIIGGTIRQAVPEGTEGAIKREYETSDGKKGVKYELKFDSLSGKITNISFRDGDFGKQMNLVITDDGKDYSLQMNTAQSFCEDLMKKLPNINLEKEVELIPYDFKDDNDKQRKGITVKQGEEKIESFYYDKEAKKTINNLPEPEGKVEDFDKEDWKVHFIKVRKFLVEETIKTNRKLEGETKSLDEIYPDDEIDPENIPF